MNKLWDVSIVRRRTSDWTDSELSDWIVHDIEGIRIEEIEGDLDYEGTGIDCTRLNYDCEDPFIFERRPAR